MSPGAGTRARNWDVGLIAWAERLRGLPFEWGATDCAILCCEAFDLMTCAQLAERYRGQYANLHGARRYQMQHGITLKTVLEAAGCTPVRPHFQQRGDFLLETAGGFACGHVCLGELALSATPEAGVAFAPVRELLARPGCEILRAP